MDTLETKLSNRQLIEEKELLAIMNIKPITLARYIKAGKLPKGTKVGFLRFFNGDDCIAALSGKSKK